MIYEPVDDGVTHINIYSKGSTELGRALTNFSKHSFQHPTFGYFSSVEGAWHWLLTGCKHDDLRYLYGAQAKNTAKLYVDDKVNIDRPLTSLEKSIIKSFIFYKIEQNADVKNLLINSSLPLAHYYYFGNILNAKVVDLPQYAWMVDYIESLRKHYKE